MKIGFNPGSIVDASGAPLQGRVLVYVHDSLEKKSIYTMEGSDYVASENPVLLDTTGRIPTTLFFDVGVVEPAQKRSIVNAILRTHPDNDILANLYAELNAMPQPTEMEMQMQDTIAKMKEAIDAKDKEIMQLTAQVDAYEKSSADFDKSLQAEFLKARQQHEFRMEENAQKAMLDQGGDAVKSAAEADKAQMDLEQKAVQLEAQKVKSATEIMKAMGV